MAKNNLTPMQDVLTREFLKLVLLEDNVLPDHPSIKKQVIAAVYSMLNYDRLGDGRFITKGKKVKMPFGTQPSLEEYPDEWQADYERAVEELEKAEAAANIKDSDEADSGQPTPYTALRQALFSKDV